MRSGLAEVVGAEGGSAFNCDLCMAVFDLRVGNPLPPCPYHHHKTWDEWLTEAMKEWAWTIMRATKYSAHIQ